MVQGRVASGQIIIMSAYATLAFYVLVLMRRCARQRVWFFSDQGLCSSRWGRRIFAHTAIDSAPVQHGSGFERIGREAHALATRNRLSYCKQIMRCLKHAGAVSLLYFTYARHQDGVWGGDSKVEEPSGDPILFCLLFILTGIVIEISPRLLTARFTDCFHFVFMSLLIWKIGNTPDIFLLTFRSRGLIPMRMCVGIWCGNPLLASMLNLAYSIASTWSYMSLCQGQQEAEDKFEPGHEICYVFDDMLATATILFTSYAIEQRGLAESRATVTAHLAKQAGTTLNSLLTALCDAVVRLGPDFEIRSGSAGLLALLLKKRTDVGVFLEYLHETDRSRFLEYATATHNLDACGAAPSLHVGMRDANGTVVDTQLFIASFPDLDNQYEYLLGIRELSREEGDIGREIALALPPPANSVSMQEFGAVPRAPCEGQSETLGCAGSDVSSSSNGSAPWQTLVRMEDPGEMAFIFNILSYVILQASPTFTGLCGPSCVGAAIDGWLLNKWEFVDWLQSTVNHMAEGHTVQTKFDCLSFQPPTAKVARLEYRADCSLEPLWTSLHDVDDDDMCARLVLSNLSQRRAKKTRTRKAERASWRLNLTLSL